MSGLARFDPSVTTLPPPKLQLQWRATPTRNAAGIAQLSSGERALHLRWSAPWLDPHPVQYQVRVPRLRDGWSPPTTEDHLDREPRSWDVAGGSCGARRGDARLERADRVGRRGRSVLV